MSTTGRSVAAAAAAARRAATPLPLPGDPFGTRDAATRCALEAVRGARADPETLATAIVNDAILDVGVRGAHGARRVRRAVARRGTRSHRRDGDFSWLSFIQRRSREGKTGRVRPTDNV
jgi:hypothetical protein